MPVDPSRLPLVLVIGGDRQQLDWITDVLRDGYELRRAYDLIQAREFLDEDIDVVLLDLDGSGVTPADLIATRAERTLDCLMVQLVGPLADVAALDTPLDATVRTPIVPEVVRSTIARLAAIATYQRDLRELYELALQKAGLESELSADELAASDEYGVLLTEIDGYRDLLDASAAALDSRQIDLVLRGIRS